MSDGNNNMQISPSFAKIKKSLAVNTNQNTSTPAGEVMGQVYDGNLNKNVFDAGQTNAPTRDAFVTQLTDIGISEEEAQIYWSVLDQDGNDKFEDKELKTFSDALYFTNYGTNNQNNDEDYNYEDITYSDINDVLGEANILDDSKLISMIDAEYDLDALRELYEDDKTILKALAQEDFDINALKSKAEVELQYMSEQIGDGMDRETVGKMFNIDSSGAYATKGTLAAASQAHGQNDGYMEKFANVNRASDLLKVEGYTTAQEGNPQVGEVVVTRNPDGTNTHSGVVVGISEEGKYQVMEFNSDNANDGAAVVEYSLNDSSEKSIVGFISGGSIKEESSQEENIAETQSVTSDFYAAEAAENTGEQTSEQEGAAEIWALEPNRAVDSDRQTAINSLAEKIGNGTTRAGVSEVLGENFNASGAYATKGTIAAASQINGADSEYMKQFVGVKKGSDLLNLDYTKATNENNAQIGDVVITQNADGTNTHSGVVVGINNDGTYQVMEFNSDDSADGNGAAIATYPASDGTGKDIIGFFPNNEARDAAREEENQKLTQGFFEGDTIEVNGTKLNSNEYNFEYNEDYSQVTIEHANGHTLQMPIGEMEALSKDQRAILLNTLQQAPEGSSLSYDADNDKVVLKDSDGNEIETDEFGNPKQNPTETVEESKTVFSASEATNYLPQAVLDQIELGDGDFELIQTSDGTYVTYGNKTYKIGTQGLNEYVASITDNKTNTIQYTKAGILQKYPEYKSTVQQYSDNVRFVEEDGKLYALDGDTKSLIS